MTSPSDYSAGVVRLGSIKAPSTQEDETTPDITNSGNETFEAKSFADFGVSDPIVDAL